MEAFSAAVDMGFRHLETDLHMTSDGVLVCVHDGTVDRTTNASGPIEGFTLAELQDLDAGFRHGTGEGFPFRGAGMKIPTLEEALTTWPDLSFVVDLKIDGLVHPLADLINQLEAHERLIVGAFSDERIEEFRKETQGRVHTSTGPVASRMWVLASRVGRKVAGEASALQVPTHLRGVKVVDPKLINVAHNAGLQVHVWTVNSRDEMENLLDIGVDGLVTDRPDVLKELLIERGEWVDS